MRKKIYCGLALLLGMTGLYSCQNGGTDYQATLHDPANYHRAMKQLTDIIVHDIFSPPVASRIYVYASIAGYEALVNGYPEYQSLAGQLNGLTPPPQPKPGMEIDFHLASLQAFTTVGQALIFSEDKMAAFRKKLHDRIQNAGMPDKLFNNSVDYGNAVAAHILAWTGKDNYKESRSFPKYSVVNEQHLWKPTPPDYVEGLEPHWMKIRTLALDSANQFMPPPPPPYSMEKDSDFYKEAFEVYEAVVNLSDEQLEIAKFWDCNPYVSHHTGHAMFATKKMTPGGHWVGVTAIAARQSQSNFMQTAEAYALVTIGLFDGFISCWDEKWRSILVRPETLINEFIDENWAPILQTPPFPEYTSGHSVVSGASSVVLTSLYGPNFSYRDTTEVEYGLPAREFTSFQSAGEEAAISRLYGGIHYRSAIVNGMAQGRDIGKWVVENVRTKKEATLANSPGN